MIMQTRARFLRCRSTVNARKSLFLSDLDTPDTRRSERDRVPMYVAVGGSPIDIPLTDRALQSYNSGSIRGFQEQGLMEAYLLEGDGTRVNVVSEDSGLVEVDTTSGPLSLVLPLNLPLGSAVIFKKVSPDANVATITAASGDTIEDGFQTVTDQGDVISLILGVSRVWRRVNASAGSTPVGPGVLTLVGPVSVDTSAAHNDCVIVTPPPLGVTITLEGSEVTPGGYIEVVKLDNTANPVFITSSSPIFGSAILTAPYETSAFRSLGLGLGWIRIA